MGWLRRAPVPGGAAPMLCPGYAGVPAVGQAQAWPPWGLWRAEPGQAGDGAAQRPRNREFQERRAEQLPRPAGGPAWTVSPIYLQTAHSYPSFVTIASTTFLVDLPHSPEATVV